MAARNIAIQFGDTVHIPAKYDGAVNKPPELSNLCTGQPDKEPHAHAPLKRPSVCEHCGPITDQSALVKGIKQGREYIVVEQDEVSDAKDYTKEFKDAISLVAHPAEEFLNVTAPGDSLYYVTPASEKQARQYKTFVAFIQAHPELVFVGLYTPQSVTALFRVGVRDGVLTMEKRVRSQALKPAPEIDAEIMPKWTAILDMELEDALVPYDQDAYEDKYVAALEAMAVETDRETTGTGTVSPVRRAPVSDDDLLSKLATLKEVA